MPSEFRCWLCGGAMYEEKVDKSGSKYLQCLTCSATSTDLHNFPTLPQRKTEAPVVTSYSAPVRASPTKSRRKK
jgi:ribosome-binding protein aMBF1 (putative translation factor)